MTPPDENASLVADDATTDGSTPPSLADLREQAERSLAAQRDARRRLEKRIDEEIDRLSEQLAEELERRRQETEEQARAGVDDDRQEFEQQRDEWERVCADIEQELGAREEHLVARESELDAATSAVQQEKRELDKWAGELADERLAIEASRRDASQENQGGATAELESLLKTARERAANAVAERDELAAHIKEIDESHASASAALQADNKRLIQELEEAKTDSADSSAAVESDEALAVLQSRFDAAQSEWTAEREALAAERSALTESLAEAGDRLGELKRVAEDSESELRGKFELAQSDVERLRGRIAELEQEVAERPAPGAAEAAELAALRSERDELHQQLDHLKSAPAADGQVDSQEIEDLRRRFEMAVEDVRQLKTENAELEQRLSDSPGASTTAGGDGALDWEAQKRRLLASLEGEGEPTTTERREERATIEGTIRITDEVVAEKDRLIAELQQQLATAPEGQLVTAPDVDMSDDERLAAERDRLAKLEQQWRDKLRAAELELSVERAKIAREQAELAEWRIEIESMRGGSQGAEAPGGEAKGQRRWLDKLGLGGGE